METNEINFSCPVPINKYDKITIGHGGGGKLMKDLIEKLFLNHFTNNELKKLHDGAVLDVNKNRLAFSTDSFVVNPLFFPGGDIGKLSVFGTTNDIAMCGARPLYLSLAFIIEEGFEIKKLEEIVKSIREAARLVPVEIVTGDTKVVDKNKGDGIYINTSCVGVVESISPVCPGSVAEGDVIIINNDIGRHGMAIMAKREGLEFDSSIISDCCSLSGIVNDLIKAGIDIHCMRDTTRGGLASALIEIACSSGFTFLIEEKEIPINHEVFGACEMLGIEPITVANEGNFISFVKKEDVVKTIDILSHSNFFPKIIGEVTKDKKSNVILNNSFGVKRVMDLQNGEQLPRIC